MRRMHSDALMGVDGGAAVSCGHRMALSAALGRHAAPSRRGPQEAGTGPLGMQLICILDQTPLIYDGRRC
jgi:hypothetical protein